MAAGPASAVERALMSAPCSIRNMTASECPSAAAHISAVSPCHDSLALMLAPRSTSSFSAGDVAGAGTCHQRRFPAGEAIAAGAPAFRSNSTTDGLPLTHAV